jgi:hypothetical protein
MSAKLSSAPARRPCCASRLARAFIPIARQIAIKPPTLGLQPRVCAADVEDERDATTAAVQFPEIVRSNRDKTRDPGKKT